MSSWREIAAGEQLDMLACPDPDRVLAPSRNVTIRGPYRFYLEPADADGRSRVIDRETGEAVGSGPWLNMFGEALRRNGLM